MVNLFGNKSQMMPKCGKNQEKWHTYGNKESIWSEILEVKSDFHIFLTI